MEKIDSFINNLYSNSQNMMYFYIVLSALALFFILLIIITLIKSSKESKKEKLEKTQTDITNTEINHREEIDTKQPASEENIVKAETEIKETIEENNEPNLIVEESNVNEVMEEEKKVVPLEENKTSKPEVYIEKDKDNEREIIANDLTIELPKVKPVDVDDYLFRRESENNKEEETKKVNEERVVVSNDELKSRLANLNSNNTEAPVKKEDNNLEDLMKTVGLEDTMVIPKLKNEEDVIGK